MNLELQEALRAFLQTHVSLPPQTSTQPEEPIPTVSEVFKQAYAYHWKGGRDAQSARGIINELTDLFGAHEPITTVTTRVVRDKVTYWRGIGNSDKTINRKLSKLNMCMKYGKTLHEPLVLPDTKRLKEQ